MQSVSYMPALFRARCLELIGLDGWVLVTVPLGSTTCTRRRWPGSGRRPGTTRRVRDGTEPSMLIPVTPLDSVDGGELDDCHPWLTQDTGPNLAAHPYVQVDPETNKLLFVGRVWVDHRIRRSGGEAGDPVVAAGGREAPALLPALPGTTFHIVAIRQPYRVRPRADSWLASFTVCLAVFWCAGSLALLSVCVLCWWSGGVPVAEQPRHPGHRPAHLQHRLPQVSRWQQRMQWTC